MVAAWAKAGAEAVWIGQNDFALVTFHVGGEGKEGEVPGFRFKVWQPEVLGRLPQPEGGFGLSFIDTKLTDAGLKELAGLKSLRTLDLETHESDRRRPEGLMNR